jgi:uncharacterized protein YPO0396
MDPSPKFEALSRLCLNNWHYIDKKVLSFHEKINFFAGHSGSGKSTIIDALQVLLYANTDGRSFFNKAAAEDSDRTLIEYLKGMVNIRDDGEYTYLRNKNFSSTVAMELRRTDTGETQCIGVVFDVLAATNDHGSRVFFRHEGALPDSMYRTPERTMSVHEVKDFIKNNYSPEQYFFESTNERFRAKLYDVYLGGLNPERFPQLFKKAIPFKMDIKLAEFVKEYICIEYDANIENMRESVRQYGRMREKIKDIQEEVTELLAVETAFDAFLSREAEAGKLRYFADSLEIMGLRQQEEICKLKDEAYRKDLIDLNQKMETAEKRIRELGCIRDELLGKIAATGYESLLANLTTLNQLIEKLSESRGNWIKTANALNEWEEQDVTTNEILWAIDEFKNFKIKNEEITRLKASLNDFRRDIQKQKNEADDELKALFKERSALFDEVKALKQGKAVYPKDLEDARREIRDGIHRRTGTNVKVEILANLIEVEDEAWKNAVEGYMANNKLLLVVPPDFAKLAMELYRKLDRNKYHSVAVLDTEKVAEKEWTVKPAALSEEVGADIDYVRSYIDYLMGGVIKCDGIDALRRQRTGITRDCELYSGFRYQHINPVHYTRYAYIGETGRKRRIAVMEKRIADIDEKTAPLADLSRDAEKILKLEHLQRDSADYAAWLKDVKEIGGKEKERSNLEKRIRELKEKNVDALDREKSDTESRLKAEESQQRSFSTLSTTILQKIERNKEDRMAKTALLEQKEKSFDKTAASEEEVLQYIGQMTARGGGTDCTNLCADFRQKHEAALAETEYLLGELRNVRFSYLKKRPNRSFSADGRKNTEYAELLKKLQHEDLEALYQKASEQAKDAIGIFKNDFVFKIRSAIKNAMEQKDQLNRIISKLDFGKDGYRFVIEKNKGADGRFYPMFMDENLEIKPSSLKNLPENQMDIFSLSHEGRYGDLISELLHIFLPPENAAPKEIEEAKRNAIKYADYRTYLSFDMDQIIKDDTEEINMKLGKMIRKNSGGEGQNPLYVALLASFAQAYRIDLAPKLRRNPTIRLVVFDEAFSKMDAEKVASCIELIRNLGFQAIISSTNDKIQSYLDSVDKTFIFANPNKKHISIREFEKKDFDGLLADL